MPKKKSEEKEETVDAVATETTDDTAVEVKADDASTEKKTRKASVKKTAEAEASEPSIVETAIETVASAAGAVVDTVSAGASALSAGASAFVSAVTGSTDEKPIHKGKRAEKIGVVASDKMTKTVTVRVDRLVKHQVYRKYVRKRKKFMAHDELGSKIGDKVRIVETRPLSARKRWRVVEIIQKAEL